MISSHSHTPPCSSSSELDRHFRGVHDLNHRRLIIRGCGWDLLYNKGQINIKIQKFRESTFTRVGIFHFKEIQCLDHKLEQLSCCLKWGVSAFLASQVKPAT